MTERPTSAVTVSWEKGIRFDAENPAGKEAAMDGTPPFGDASAMSPMELLLASLGGCTGMDVVGILKKKRQDVTDYRIEVEGVKAAEHPHVFTDITIRHVLTGRNLSEEAVRRSIELSEGKYCSAMAMLRKAANISSSFVIENIEAVEAVPKD